MARMPEGFIDLTVTSPPYDDLRKYNGYSFDFEAVAPGLFRVTKDGGVVVWVVNDRTVDGDESGTSFRQALYFKEVGFKLWDTMIWLKANPMPVDSRIPRYVPSFEYMFVFSKGVPKTFNPFRDACVEAGSSAHNDYPARRENGSKSNERVVSKTSVVLETKVRSNVWIMPSNGTPDAIARNHPAIFPEVVASNHILSWSNLSDVVYDPFMGSGTTAKAAHQLGRNWIGSEISAEYVDLANKRLEPYLMQEGLFK